MIESYLRANNMFVDYNEVWTSLISLLYFIMSTRFLTPNIGTLLQPQQERAYTSYLQLDLGHVEPCISGPKRYTFTSF